MSPFPNNSPFTRTIVYPRLFSENENIRQRQEERETHLAHKKISAKEDAIHALRRVEMDLRRDNQHELADDLDSAINQVIGILIIIL